ncbi:Clp protease N-terminal domain-containing protein [Spirillospora sp. NPDC029432]|uniref:Clp protease N-terminal domain-containing protein n=1 Tax=Spirillospora sp. NPDC029432 TaxID=3154599 RepID=UPI0034555541
MRPEPCLATDVSREAMESLVRTFERAARLGLPGVGTEHLLFALLKGQSAAVEVLVPKAGAAGSLMGVVAHRHPGQWISEDGGGDPAPAAAALLREAEWSARKKREGRTGDEQPGAPAPPSAALAAAIDRALLSAREHGAARAGTTHLLIGLLQDPGNRASEALEERGLDRREVLARLAVHPSAREDGTPNALSVDGLRNMGLLTRRGRFWGGLAAKLSGGGHGSPMVPTVRLEAERQAVRLGHATVTTVHLLVAMLVLDEQLAAAGDRLRDDLAGLNGAAGLLRERGATAAAAAAASAGLAPAGEFVPDEDGPAWRALARARRLAQERGDASTGTVHVLTALLDDPDDPCGGLLASIGVDVAELRRALAA